MSPRADGSDPGVKSSSTTSKILVRIYPSGSKIVFKRHSTLDGKMPDIYLHTGVLIRIDDEDYVIEVQKDEEKRYPPS